MDERDRIGDTVSPTIGPTFPFKIKTVTDIYQLSDYVQVKYKSGTLYPNDLKPEDLSALKNHKLNTSKIKLMPEKKNVALVLDSAFNPIHIGHLNMFENIKNYLTQQGVNVAGGFLSAANQGYGKPGLIEAHHRINMIKRAVSKSDWIMVDEWDCAQDQWQLTAGVLNRMKKGLENLNVQPILMIGSDAYLSFEHVYDNG